MTEKRITKTYQEQGTGRWVTEDYGRVRPATAEEIENTINRWRREGNPWKNR
jgi:hypothetical protein